MSEYRPKKWMRCHAFFYDIDCHPYFFVSITVDSQNKIKKSLLLNLVHQINSMTRQKLKTSLVFDTLTNRLLLEKKSEIILSPAASIKTKKDSGTSSSHVEIQIAFAWWVWGCQLPPVTVKL
jgi:hypothetical protein